MKYFAFSINGEEIPVPNDIKPIASLDNPLERIVSVGLQAFIVITIILSLFFLIYSGIQWTTSGGDKQKLQQARARVTYSIVGLLVALLAMFIVNIIGNLLGISFFTP